MATLLAITVLLPLFGSLVLVLTPRLENTPRGQSGSGLRWRRSP